MADSTKAQIEQLVLKMNEAQLVQFINAIRHDIPIDTWEALKKCVEGLDGGHK